MMRDKPKCKIWKRHVRKYTSQLQIQVGLVHWDHYSSIIQESHYWKTSSVLLNSIFCTDQIHCYFPPEWNTPVTKKISYRSLIMRRNLGIKKIYSMNFLLCKKKWRFFFKTHKKIWVFFLTQVLNWSDVTEVS